MTNQGLKLMYRSVNSVGNQPCATRIHVIRKNTQTVGMNMTALPVKSVCVNATGGSTSERIFD